MGKVKNMFEILYEDNHIIVAEKGGLRSFSSDVFIDCSGDGDLCALAGADYEKSDVLQPGTLGFNFRCNNANELDRDEIQAKFNEKRDAGEIVHGDHWPAYHAHIMGFFKAGGKPFLFAAEGKELFVLACKVRTHFGGTPFSGGFSFTATIKMHNAKCIMHN